MTQIFETQPITSHHWLGPFRYGEVGDEPTPSFLLLAEPRQPKAVEFFQQLTEPDPRYEDQPLRNYLLHHPLWHICGVTKPSRVANHQVDPLVYEPLAPLVTWKGTEYLYDPNVARTIWNRLHPRVELEREGGVHLLVGKARQLAWAGDVLDLEQGFDLHLPLTPQSADFLGALKDITAEKMAYSPNQIQAMGMGAAYGGSPVPENQVVEPAPTWRELQPLLSELAATHAVQLRAIEERPGRLPLLSRYETFSEPMFLQWMFDLGYRCEKDGLPFPGFQSVDGGPDVMHIDGERVEQVNSHTGMLRSALGRRYAQNDLRPVDLETIQKNKIRLPKGT